MKWFEPHENRQKTHSDPESRVPQDLQDLGHFSRNSVLVKNRIKLDVEGGYKRHKQQQKYMVYLPYFGKDLVSKKKLVGILAYVCLWRHSHVTGPAPVKQKLPKVAQKMLHKLCKISARSAHRFGGHYRKTVPSTLPARARVKYFWR